ncbi:hypothetical protein [Aquimarina sp. AU119]|uniref:hypothetical protein n=1 Tax=Aquimarina sp. AU119 TaxID=2108528 RepID=UPI000D693602|nr:hypothetical protein [Aquimarina sp. AU119]
MFSAENIKNLNERIGWKQPIEEGLDSIVSDENQTSESGRFFQDFSQLVTIKNLHGCAPQAHLNDEFFNQYLKELRESVVLTVLNDVFSYNNNSCLNTDYNPCIESNINNFDNSLGYMMARKVIEIIIHTHRSNMESKEALYSYSELMSELNGVFDSRNRLIVDGLAQKYDKSIEKLSNCIVGRSGVFIESVNLW